jgi:hypothetical protein
MEIQVTVGYDRIREGASRPTNILQYFTTTLIRFPQTVVLPGFVLVQAIEGTTIWLCSSMVVGLIASFVKMPLIKG